MHARDRSRAAAAQPRSTSLLVSVASADEARAALDGGADVIDAKDPGRGALGPVTLDALRAIVDVVRGRCPVSAALGDAATEEAIARDARDYVRAGATIVKVGLAGVTQPARAGALLRAAAHGAGPEGGRVVAVACPDTTDAPPPLLLVEIAAAAGIDGVLLDTTDKTGPALPELVTADALSRWVDCAHAAGLWTAVAGRLTASTLACAWRAGADVVGVRGAACDGGRSGLVSRERVRALRARLDAAVIRPAAAASGPVDRRAPRPRAGARA